MILLLGATGYVGQAFSAELRRRGRPFIPLTRRAVDYTNFNQLFAYVRRMRPTFLINAAGYSPHPNVDASESAQREVLFANAILPQTIARVCAITRTPWGHVSSGSIFSGAKIRAESGTWRIQRNLNQPEIRRLFALDPGRFRGFSEDDEPNFSFRHTPCNHYSGSKALAEENIIDLHSNYYIWRPRMLFSAQEDPRNLLTKLLHFERVYDNVNSLTRLEDFVRASLDLWQRRAPFGIYNMVNPGAVTTSRIVELIRLILHPDRDFVFWSGDNEFYQCVARVPRSNCILDATKLLSTGIPMPRVEDALESALVNMQLTQAPMTFVAEETQPWLHPSGREAFESLFEPKN